MNAHHLSSKRDAQARAGDERSAVDGGVRARVLRSGGTPSDPVPFSDGVMASVRPAGLQVHRVAEIKLGSEGGSEAQEQLHRWIEKHGTTETEIPLPGVPRPGPPAAEAARP